jgi:hypothetical protein
MANLRTTPMEDALARAEASLAERKRAMRVADAAADLLAALKAMVGLVELIIPTLEGPPPRIGVPRAVANAAQYNHRLDAARAAIVKAEGISP